MLSRTSISQTLANLDLIWEPGSSFPVLADYDAEKPLLVIRHRQGTLNPNEGRILGKSVPVDSSSTLLFYRLSPDTLQAILREHQGEMAEMAELCMQDAPGSWHYFESYDSLENGQFSGAVKDYTGFAGCCLPDSGTYIVSFWYEGAGKDLWPRTNLFVSLFDSSMQNYYYPRTDFFRVTVMREGEWALVAVPIEVRHPGDILKLHYINQLLTKGEMRIDRVLVRPASQNVVLGDDGVVLMNNYILPYDVTLHFNSSGNRIPLSRFPGSP
jgi:hypothetical protein